MKYSAIIFDVDGVLIDTSDSFSAAAADAVRITTGSQQFTSEMARQLKLVPGFNNDWHVAIAGAGWVIRNDLAFADWLDQLTDLGGGLPAVRQLAGPGLTLASESRLTKQAMETYGGASACRRLYGFDPGTANLPGHWQQERPLLSRESALPLLPLSGIVTGRSRSEMELGFQVLGWRLPWERVAVSDDPYLDKPNPARLLELISQLPVGNTLYVGDSRDDLLMVENARARSRIDFGLIGTNRVDWPGITLRAPDVTKLLQTIEVTND